MIESEERRLRTGTFEKQRTVKGVDGIDAMYTPRLFLW